VFIKLQPLDGMSSFYPYPSFYAIDDHWFSVNRFGGGNEIVVTPIQLLDLPLGISIIG